jgi:hypothetical protein
MKLRILALSSCVALLASACSGGGSPGANQSAAANTAAVAAPAPAPATPELLGRIVECSASFEAVGNLFGAIAETKSGPEREELTRTSDQRLRLAQALRARAVAVGGGLGVPQADIEARLAAAKARNLAESRAGDFAEFAGRMGRQADQCTRGMSELM